MPKKYIFIALGLIVLVSFLAPKSIEVKPTATPIVEAKTSSQVTEENKPTSALTADEPKRVHINPESTPAPKTVEVEVENNVEAKTGCTATMSPSTMVTVKRINYFIDFFRSQSFSCQGAVIMTASLIQESYLDPLAVGDAGHAHGIAQWRDDVGFPKTRLAGLQKQCNPWGDIDCQMQYIITELKQRDQYTPFTTEDTANIKATVAKYEGYSHEGKRFEFSRAIYKSIK